MRVGEAGVADMAWAFLIGWDKAGDFTGGFGIGLIQRKVRAWAPGDASRMASSQLPPLPLPLAVRVIRAEHDALAAMLRTLPLLLREQRLGGIEPDFGALRAMLFYVDEFPERLHHPKESELLFPRLRALAPSLRHSLDALDADHVQGERAIRELQHSLLAWEHMGESRRDKFELQLGIYCSRYLGHMRREESEILPQALALLQPRDWEDLDEAFGANCDPLAPLEGFPSDAAYAPLRERILSALPEPFGWASPGLEQVRAARGGGGRGLGPRAVHRARGGD